jgi:uncharacterized protein (TIGR03067 family)
MRTTWYLAGVALMVFVVRAQAEERKEAKGDLTGTYKVVSCEKDGKEEAPDKFKGHTVKITKTEMVGMDASGKRVWAATFRLDNSQKPWAIELTMTEGEHKGETLKGILEQAGNKLRCCHAEPGGKTPTEFKAGEKQKCAVLEKEASEK